MKNKYRNVLLFVFALAGFFLWRKVFGSHQEEKHMVLSEQHVAPGTHNGFSQGVDEVALHEEEVVDLIHQKIKDLKDAGMLRNLTMRNCTPDQTLNNGFSQGVDEVALHEEEVVDLIHQKIKDLKDAGMLRNLTMRNCTPDQALNSRCVDTNCIKPLHENTSKENVRSILTPVRKVGMKKLKEAIDAFSLKPTGKKYTIVTGASSDHFGEVQEAIRLLHKNVFPNLSNFSFYFYDLGLNEQERMLVRNFSGAELRKFPFSKFSPSTRYLKCYLWKPLIILAHLQNTDFLVWLDASVRYKKSMTSYFETVATTGFLSTTNGYQMAQHTSSMFFSYFGDEACQFSVYDEVEGGHVVLHNEPFTQRVLLEPWAACALDPDCMCPPESRKMLMCSQKFRRYSKCHRYDQSAIGILLAKVFRQNVASVHIQNPIHSVSQGSASNFLRDLAKGKKP